MDANIAIGSGIPSSLPSKPALEANNHEDPLTQKLEMIAKKILLGPAPCLAINIGTMAALSWAPLSMSVISLSLIVASGAYACYHILEDAPDAIGKTIEDCLDKLTKFSHVSWVGRIAPQAFLHECGHALAALATLKDTKLDLSIYPFKGGMLEVIESKGYTKFGEWLGANGSKMLFLAGGVIASTASALGCVGIARALQENHPEISEALNMYAVSTVLGEMMYGFLSLYDPSLHSDFTLLYQLSGVHPLLIMLIIAGSPWLLYQLIKK